MSAAYSSYKKKLKKSQKINFLLANFRKSRELLLIFVIFSSKILVKIKNISKNSFLLANFKKSRELLLIKICDFLFQNSRMGKKISNIKSPRDLVRFRLLCFMLAFEIACFLRELW